MHLSLLSSCIGIYITVISSSFGTCSGVSSSSSSSSTSTSSTTSSSTLPGAPFRPTRRYSPFIGENAQRARSRRQEAKKQASQTMDDTNKEQQQPRSLQSSNNGGEWPTEHYDLINSGSTTYIGPGNTDGFCRAFFLEDSPIDPNAELFYATGVTALSPYNVWFGGGTSNVFRIIQMHQFGYFDEWDVPLSTFRPNNTFPATPYGIVASGSVWIQDIADSIAVPSADGNIYTLWWLSCIDLSRGYENGTLKMNMHPFDAEVLAYEEIPAEPLPGASFNPKMAAKVYGVNQQKRMEYLYGSSYSSSSARSLQPLPNCLQWVANLNNNPSFSPTRHVPGNSEAPISLVLASETNKDLDMGGILHAFNSKSGAEFWNHPAIDNTGVSWGLTGVVPAVDINRRNMVFLAYGPRVVALDGSTGIVVAEVNDTGIPDAAEPGDYVYYKGYLDDGDDILFATNITYLQAVAMCNNLTNCVGFTHQDPDPYPTVPVNFWFKSAWKFTPSLSNWASFERPGFGIDPFVSSPVLSQDGTALYLHSAAGTLWKINVVGRNSVSMSIAWGCDYLVNSPANYTTCLSPPSVYKRSFPKPVYNDDGVPLPGTETHDVQYRGDYVNGGWYQATTRGQRDELHDAIRDAYLSSRENAEEAKRIAAEQLYKRRIERELNRKPVNDAPPTVNLNELDYDIDNYERGAPLSSKEMELLQTIPELDQPSPDQVTAMLRSLTREGQLGLIQNLRTRSGYVRLDGRTGRPAFREDFSDPIFEHWATVYPYSTPAMENNQLFGFPALVVPQYLPYIRGDEGVFVIMQTDGSYVWGFDHWVTTEKQTVNFGRSRSSPVIDGSDFVYVAADVDDPRFSNTSAFTSPALFALDLLDGTLVWGTTMGFPVGTAVGHASPIIIDGYSEAHTAMMAADHGLVILGEGTSCPTDDPIFECSGHGDCDCTSGTCTCDPGNLCYGGPDCSSTCINGVCDPSVGGCFCDPCFGGFKCSVPVTCGVNSFCNVPTDSCVCSPCYSLDNLGFCTVFNTCSGHGTCNGAAGGCTCDPGYSGSDCSIGVANAPAGTIAAEAVGTLVGLPVTMLIVGAAYLFYFKYKNPLKPLHAALPTQIQKRLGYSVYSSQFTAPEGASSPTKGGSSSSSEASGASKYLNKLKNAVSSPKSLVNTNSLMVKGSSTSTEEALARTRLLASSGTKPGTGLSMSAGSKGGYGGL